MALISVVYNHYTMLKGAFHQVRCARGLLYLLRKISEVEAKIVSKDSNIPERVSHIIFSCGS